MNFERDHDPLVRGALLGLRDRDPLEVASSRGHVGVVRLILGWNENDGRVSQASVNSALKSACNQGHLKVARCLVEYGIDNNALVSALYLAVIHHRLEVAAYLIDRGVNFNIIASSSDRSVWMLACSQDSPEMVCLFLDHGADPSAVDARGVSPLQAALSHPEVLRVLMFQGADPNQLFGDGSTPLLYLVRQRQGDHMQAITVLLELGADPDLAFDTTTGETVLMMAAVGHRVDLVKLLLKHGADVTQVNREGKSVLDIVGRFRRYDDVVQLCTQYIESNKPGVKLLLK